MKFRFTIGRKIGTGFGVLIFLTLFAFLLTSVTLRTGRQKTNQVTDIYTPSVGYLKDLNSRIVRSQMLINNWVYYQSNDDNPNKKELRNLIRHVYPSFRNRINEYKEKWNDPVTQKTVDSIFVQIDSLFNQEKIIMDQLSSFTSYEDPAALFIVRPMVDEDGVISVQSKTIIEKLTKVIEKEQFTAAAVTSEMLDSFDFLDKIVKVLGAALVAGGIIIALFTVRSIVRPVKLLKNMLLTMGKGVLPKSRTKESSDEIGEMASAMNKLVEALHRTTEFANEVGKGNFESDYTPLSEEDQLGNSLLKMRRDLHVNEQILERKVIERTEEVVRQKQEIEVKNRELEVLYKHVTDSIRYAKRIQESILPPESVTRKLLPNSFVLFKPKDIVSGDFYWISEKGDKIIFSAVDCTGHGVPGAFMSLVAYNLLKEIIESMIDLRPAKILDELSAGVRNTLHQFDKSSAKDGMDIALCILDTKKMELQYSGAFNPLYLVRNNNLQEIKADKLLIGFSYSEDHHEQTYTNHTIKMQKGDTIYISSDGYHDQFGGPKGRKFMVTSFRQLLLDVHNLPIDDQKRILDERFEEWKGAHDQVDDICVMAVKV
jgi:serine phosphatase RsbU (regulator of sigma subunit)/HAMP domain-containing protein